jgi:hypothetical protein
MANIKTKWTKKQEKLISEGKIPAGKTYGQCYMHAKNLGFQFSHRDARNTRWTADEDAFVRAGKIPAGRTWNACYQRSRHIGCFHLWQMSDRVLGQVIDERALVERMRQNLPVEGISDEYARYIGRKHGIFSYRPKQMASRQKNVEMCGKIVRLLERGKTFKEIGAKFGYTPQYAHFIYNKFKSELPG